MSNTTTLGKTMIARANDDELADDHPLRMLGKAFDTAAEGFYNSPQTVDVKTFMGHWARARRAWSDYSGEPLVGR